MCYQYAREQRDSARHRPGQPIMLLRLAKAALLNYEAFVILYRSIHDLSELNA